VDTLKQPTGRAGCGCEFASLGDRNGGRIALRVKGISLPSGLLRPLPGQPLGRALLRRQAGLFLPNWREISVMAARTSAEIFTLITLRSTPDGVWWRLGEGLRRSSSHASVFYVQVDWFSDYPNFRVNHRKFSISINSLLRWSYCT